MWTFFEKFQRLALVASTKILNFDLINVLGEVSVEILGRY